MSSINYFHIGYWLIWGFELRSLKYFSKIFLRSSTRRHFLAPYWGFTIYEWSEKFIPGINIFNWLWRLQKSLYFLLILHDLCPFFISSRYSVYGFDSESFNKVCFTSISIKWETDYCLSVGAFLKLSGPKIQMLRCWGKIAGTKNLEQFWHCMQEEFFTHFLNYFIFFSFYSACSNLCSRCFRANAIFLFASVNSIVCCLSTS